MGAALVGLSVAFQIKTGSTRRRPVNEPVAGPPGAPGDRYQVSRLSTLGELTALRPEWETLYEASHQNPFCDPGWLLAWARTYIGDRDDLWAVAVRRDGVLVGMLPCYVARTGFGPLAFRTMQVFGQSAGTNVTELAAGLLHPDDPRGIFRAAVRYLVAHAPVRWHQLILDRDVPWLDPHWFRPASKDERRPVILPREPRPCVTLTLPDSPDGLVLKRNVKESVRRARNRLTKSGRSWSLRLVTDPAEMESAFDELRRLHLARATLPGKERHYNALPEREAEFVRRAVLDGAARGRAAIYQLQIEGEVVASQLVLTTSKASYLSLSGLTEAAWDYSPMALIIHTVALDGIRRGASRLHLSVGPDEAKMRWSEQIDYYPVFVVVPPTPAAQAVFSIYWPVAALSRFRGERRFHSVRDD